MSSTTNRWNPCLVHASQNLTDGPCRECALEPAPPIPRNPCYRVHRGIAHEAHSWRNGIEVQYDVRCPGSDAHTTQTRGA